MTNPTHDQRRRHLALHLEASGLKRADYCRKYDISPSYLSQILSGGCRFGEKAARSMEEKLHLPVGSLDNEKENDLNLIEVWESANDLPDNSFALVPRLSISLKMGLTSKTTGEELLPPLAFRTDWLKKKNVTHRDNLRTCDMQGDSMEPYVQDGDSILIDIGQTDIQDNQIYAIRYGDEIRIKRLSKRFDGGLMIRSDNPKHPDETLTATEAQMITILGRMLWRGG